MSMLAHTPSQIVDPEARPKPGWRSVTVALSAIVLVGLIPVLEVNDSHLFNPEWPAHARFHEAWQLLTNAGLALFSLWLAVVGGRERLAAGLSLIMVGALVIAWGLGGVYGGEIGRPGGEGLQVFGLGLPALIMSMLAIALTAAVWPQTRKFMRL
jgi:hypothetical protein